MFRPAWNNPYGFDASSSGDPTLPPPTMLTEAFVAAHTEVLCQLLQAQQRTAQKLQQMPPMQQKIQSSKPCSPEVPTQRDINAVVGATQLLEGQNSVLSQMVYDVIQGRYRKPYQNSLVDSLSQSFFLGKYCGGVPHSLKNLNKPKGVYVQAGAREIKEGEKRLPLH
jgi:hypothetical protein